MHSIKYSNFKTLSAILGFITLALVLTGCGGSANVMKEVNPQKIKSPASDKAQIVFMRSSFVAGAITAELFDVTNGEIKFIGALPNGKKVAYETTPGEKVFMTFGSAADFMKANVAAGKRYYSIVRPNWGTGGFAPTPIKNNGSTKYNTGIPEFQEWLSDTTLIEADKAQADTWYAEHKEKMQKIYDEYWKRFNTKTAAQISERTIFPEDGVNP